MQFWKILKKTKTESILSILAPSAGKWRPFENRGVGGPGVFGKKIWNWTGLHNAYVSQNESPVILN